MKKLLLAVFLTVALSGCLDSVVPENVTVGADVPDQTFVVFGELHFMTVSDGLTAWVVAEGKQCFDELLTEDTLVFEADGVTPVIDPVTGLQEIAQTPILGADNLQVTCMFPAQTVGGWVTNDLPIVEY